MKRQVVVDALTRIGRVDQSHVERLLAMMPEPAEVVQTGYRTTVRAALRDGRSGYRRRGSREVVVPTMCGVAHPDLEDLLLAGRFRSGAGDEVVLRVSAASGERLAVVDGDVAAVDLPSDVTVTSRRELAEGRSTFITEEAAGRSWRVSAGSFFQAGPTVATALVDAVGGLVGEVDDLVVVDAYAGIGLFGGTVGSRAARLISVEESGSSSDDARVNLAGIEAEIVESRVEHWAPERADVVIADPARAGLRAEGVAVLDRCDASRFVLISCDTGSLGRDVGLLVEAGYALDSLRIVDAFPDTGHVETVVGLSR